MEIASIAYLKQIILNAFKSNCANIDNNVVNAKFHTHVITTVSTKASAGTFVWSITLNGITPKYGITYQAVTTSQLSQYIDQLFNKNNLCKEIINVADLSYFIEVLIEFIHANVIQYVSCYNSPSRPLTRSLSGTRNADVLTVFNANNATTLFYVTKKITTQYLSSNIIQYLETIVSKLITRCASLNILTYTLNYLKA